MDNTDILILATVRQMKVPPSLRELCDLTNVKSTDTMWGKIQNLIKLGYLQQASTAEDRMARTVTVTDKGRDVFPELVMFKDGRKVE